jgi:hypothetical protein
MNKNQLTKEQLETIILQDSNIVSVSRPEHIFIPQIDPDLWISKVRDDRMRKIRFCITYLQMPRLIDRFQDKDHRKEWVREMQEKYKGFFEFYDTNNDLRYNHLKGISMVMTDFHLGYIGTCQEQLVELKEELEIIPAIVVYDAITTVQKIGIVNRYKKRIVDLLDFLSEQSSIESNLIG